MCHFLVPSRFGIVACGFSRIVIGNLQMLCRRLCAGNRFGNEACWGYGGTSSKRNEYDCVDSMCDFHHRSSSGMLLNGTIRRLTERYPLNYIYVTFLKGLKIKERHLISSKEEG